MNAKQRQALGNAEFDSWGRDFVAAKPQVQQPQQRAAQLPVPPLPVGCGVMEAKPATEAVIYTGKLVLPVIGQCWIDGHRAFLQQEYELDVLKPGAKPGERTKVATISLPRFASSDLGTRAEGHVHIHTETGKPDKVWKLRATIKTGTRGGYIALKMPDVKVARAM